MAWPVMSRPMNSCWIHQHQNSGIEPPGEKGADGSSRSANGGHVFQSRKRWPMDPNEVDDYEEPGCCLFLKNTSWNNKVVDIWPWIKPRITRSNSPNIFSSSERVPSSSIAAPWNAWAPGPLRSSHGPKHPEPGLFKEVLFAEESGYPLENDHISHLGKFGKSSSKLTFQGMMGGVRLIKLIHLHPSTVSNYQFRIS